MPAAALDAATFAAAMARLGPFEDRPAIAVGVSGGADSMALALLLDDWLGVRGGRLLALVVDHRLRAGSTDEAARVVGWLDALGIEARLLTRQGPPLTTAVQAAARDVRYTLLEAATAAAGMLHLAVAHHARDQRETIALRRAGGSGPRGLAGMPEVRELDQIRIIRPLLGVEPERLRTVLQCRRVGWLEDPSNTNRRFWRASHRASTVETPSSDAPYADATRAARRSIDRRIAAFLAQHAQLSPLGCIALDAAPLVALANDFLPHVLGRVIATVGGRTWPPAAAKLERLAAWLRGAGGSGSALGGVLLARKRGEVRFVREARAVAAPAVLPADGMVWDGRFRIDGVGLDDRLEVAAAGPGWRSRLRARSPGRQGAGFGSAVPATVLATLPLIRSEAGPVALGPWPVADAGGAPRVRFRPRARLADAAFCQSSMALVVSPR